ncbi:hypothetical protein [Bradyrhizobium guangzhouense]|uniref:hypothetical protein n=1 Tax=Bradyrhizobium guangzhouense TaxID=1325095 RepID=UPI0010099267|nr:hypothetical protein [Bradyrhizobium guangzhouense]RXH19513.1 hypothetical protein EAS54_08190 [Bradyrhizobium guangzhouense]
MASSRDFFVQARKLASRLAIFFLTCIAVRELEGVALQEIWRRGPMYQFRVPEFFLGCFLTVAVFAAGMLFEGDQHSSRPLQAIEKHEASGQSSKPETPDTELLGSTWLTKDAAGFFTFGLVVVGVGQAILFFFQLHFMRQGMDDATLAAKAAQASAETAKEQVALTKVGIIDLERAYLAVGPTKITVDFVKSDVANARGFYMPTDPQELTAHLYVQNTGRTGATVKKIYGILTDSEPIGDTPFYPPQPQQPSLTDLSVAATAQSVLDPFEFKSDLIGEQFFWGYIEYTDIFKNRRTSRFCAHLSPAERGKSGKYQIAGTDAWRECD